MRTWQHDFYAHLFDRIEYPAFERGQWAEIHRFNILLRGAHWHYHGTRERARRDEKAKRKNLRDAIAAMRGPLPRDKEWRLERRRKQYAAKVAARKKISSNAAMVNRLDAKTFWQAQAMAGAV